MKMRHMIGLLVLIVLVVSISGCKKQAPAVPTAPVETPKVTEPAKEIPKAKEQLKNVQETSTGFCGDNICQNVENQYPDSKVVCGVTGCTINGKYTENNYNCPRDCGTTCTENTVIGFKPPACKLLSNGDIQLSITNSGRDTINGFLFYVSEKPVAEAGRVGYSTSEKDLAKGETGVYTVDVAKWKEQFGSINMIQVMPRIIENGQTKECSNQKNIVPMSSCK